MRVNLPCALCGKEKPFGARKYCPECSKKLSDLPYSMNIKQKISYIKNEDKRKLKASIQAVETMAELPKKRCPCKPWGLGLAGCMFNHCVRDDGFNAGRVRLRDD